MEGLGAGPHDDEDAHEAHGDGRPAAPADRFAEHRDRERADQQRHGEGDGAGHRQRQILDGEEVHEGGAQKRQRPQGLELEIAGAQHLPAMAREMDDRHQREMDEIAQIDDLHGGNAHHAQPFGGGVDAGEHEVGGERQADPQKPVLFGTGIGCGHRGSMRAARTAAPPRSAKRPALSTRPSCGRAGRAIRF